MPSDKTVMIYKANNFGSQESAIQNNAPSKTSNPISLDFELQKKPGKYSLSTPQMSNFERRIQLDQARQMPRIVGGGEPSRSSRRICQRSSCPANQLRHRDQQTDPRRTIATQTDELPICEQPPPAAQPKQIPCGQCAQNPDSPCAQLLRQAERREEPPPKPLPPPVPRDPSCCDCEEPMSANSSNVRATCGCFPRCKGKKKGKAAKTPPQKYNKAPPVRSVPCRQCAANPESPCARHVQSAPQEEPPKEQPQVEPPPVPPPRVKREQCECGAQPQPTSSSHDRPATGCCNFCKKKKKKSTPKPQETPPSPKTNQKEKKKIPEPEKPCPCVDVVPERDDCCCNGKRLECLELQMAELRKALSCIKCELASHKSSGNTAQLQQRLDCIAKALESARQQDLAVENSSSLTCRQECMQNVQYYKMPSQTRTTEQPNKRTTVAPTESTAKGRQDSGKATQSPQQLGKVLDVSSSSLVLRCGFGKKAGNKARHQCRALETNVCDCAKEEEQPKPIPPEPTKPQREKKKPLTEPPQKPCKCSLPPSKSEPKVEPKKVCNCCLPQKKSEPKVEPCSLPQSKSEPKVEPKKLCNCSPTQKKSEPKIEPKKVCNCSLPQKKSEPKVDPCSLPPSKSEPKVEAKKVCNCCLPQKKSEPKVEPCSLPQSKSEPKVQPKKICNCSPMPKKSEPKIEPKKVCNCSPTKKKSEPKVEQAAPSQPKPCKPVRRKPRQCDESIQVSLLLSTKTTTEEKEVQTVSFHCVESTKMVQPDVRERCPIPDPPPRSKPCPRKVNDRPPQKDAETSTTQVIKPCSRCKMCCQQESVELITCNLWNVVLNEIGGHKPGNVALTVVMESPDLYHINVSLMKTSESLCCLYCTEGALNQALNQRMFDEFLTFFLMDAQNSEEDKVKFFNCSFELMN